MPDSFGNQECALVDISDQDVIHAMKSMQGYIDITPADFKEIYRVAFTMAKERVMASVKAGDIMSRPVACIASGMDLMAAAALLADKGVSGAPVVDRDGRVVGVVSEKDFLRKMGAGRTMSFMQVIANCLKDKGCVAAPMLRQTIGDIMTAPAVTSPADITMAGISALLKEKNINRLPIVDGDERPIGIVTRSDLVNAFCLLG
jgi:CBS domain-containing protein